MYVRHISLLLVVPLLLLLLLLLHHKHHLKLLKLHPELHSSRWWKHRVGHHHHALLHLHLQHHTIHHCWIPWIAVTFLFGFIIPCIFVVAPGLGGRLRSFLGLSLATISFRLHIGDLQLHRPHHRF